MEINGLPLHPLVVHAAVIFGPLAALIALAYVLLPSWRDRLRWPMLAAALIAAATLYTAYLTGINFRDSKDFFTQGPLADKVATHAHRAGQLRWVTIGFAIVAVLSAWLHSRTGAVRVVLNVLLAVAALAVLVFVTLTGEAGARAVWGN